MTNANTCVVCGRFSTRPAWNVNINALDGNNLPTVYVACDFHSLSEIEAAILNVGGSPTTGNNVVNQDTSVSESPQS